MTGKESGRTVISKWFENVVTVAQGFGVVFMVWLCILASEGIQAEMTRETMTRIGKGDARVGWETSMVERQRGERSNQIDWKKVNGGLNRVLYFLVTGN